MYEGVGLGRWKLAAKRAANGDDRLEKRKCVQCLILYDQRCSERHEMPRKGRAVQVPRGHWNAAARGWLVNKAGWRGRIQRPLAAACCAGPGRRCSEDGPYRCAHRPSNAPIMRCTTCRRWKPVRLEGKPHRQAARGARHNGNNRRATAASPAEPATHRPRRVRQSGGRTSSKKTEATCRYSGDLKAKSTSKLSQVVWGVGPSLRSASGSAQLNPQPAAQGEAEPRRTGRAVAMVQRTRVHGLLALDTLPAHLNSHLLVRWEKRVELSTRECTAEGHCSVTLLVYLGGGDGLWVGHGGGLWVWVVVVVVGRGAAHAHGSPSQGGDAKLTTNQPAGTALRARFWLRPAGRPGTRRSRRTQQSNCRDRYGSGGPRERPAPHPTHPTHLPQPSLLARRPHRSTNIWNPTSSSASR